MADAGIKNVIIKKELLGKVTISNSNAVRFRIVSEDKNRKSAWSQIFLVDSAPVLVLPGDLNIIGNTILVNWSNGSGSSIQVLYDVFASFDGADFIHLGTSNNSIYSFLKNGTTSVRVVVQIASISPVINGSLQVYNSGLKSLV